jgi:hypothetical protein
MYNIISAVSVVELNDTSAVLTTPANRTNEPLLDTVDDELETVIEFTAPKNSDVVKALMVDDEMTISIPVPFCARTTSPAPALIVADRNDSETFVEVPAMLNILYEPEELTDTPVPMVIAAFDKACANRNESANPVEMTQLERNCPTKEPTAVLCAMTVPPLERKWDDRVASTVTLVMVPV